MAGAPEDGDHAALGESQMFPNGAQQHYPPPHHYPTAYPPLDHDITMDDSFAPARSRNGIEDLQNAAAAATNSAQHSITVNTNGASSEQVAMAPPHTPTFNQPSPPPTESRPSLDFTADRQGSLKRKRSKVSRACDECRRKKVKCDADEGEGTEIKTCTNCEKASMKCEFSRVPMRRGPSKGYINALASRVDEMEKQQAATINRLSMDGSTADHVYSPEEVMSGRRQFSFSEGKNPFAPADYQRDRMPSIGPWNVNNTPTSAGTKSRDRGSLALAPDQHLPLVAYPPFIKPPWSEFEEPPSAKRQKLDSTMINLEPIALEPKHFNKYYEMLHGELDMLPDVEITIRILQQASPPLQRWFRQVVDGIGSVKGDAASKPDHTNERSNGVDTLATDDLVRYVSPATPPNPSKEDMIDRLIFIWTAIILSTELDYDVKEMINGDYSRANLLRLAYSTTVALQKIDAASIEGVEGFDMRILSQQLSKAHNTSVALGRFHSFGMATDEFVHFDSFDIQSEAGMRPHINLICLASNPLAHITAALQTRSIPPDAVYASTMEYSSATLIALFADQAGLQQEELIVRQVKLFFDLLLARLLYDGLPHKIITPAARLADLLPQTPSNPIVSMHMYTVAVFTIIEYLSVYNNDSDFVAIAEHALDTIQTALTQLNNESQTLRSSWNVILLRYLDDSRKQGWHAQQGVYNFGELLRKGYLLILRNMALKYEAEAA